MRTVNTNTPDVVALSIYAPSNNMGRTTIDTDSTNGIPNKGRTISKQCNSTINF